MRGDQLFSNMYQLMNVGTVGDTLTAALLNNNPNGFRGALFDVGQSWSVSTSPMTGVTLQAHQRNLRNTLNNNGVLYSPTAASKSIAMDHAAAGQKQWRIFTDTGKRRMSIAGWLTFGAPSNASALLYDYFIFIGAVTGQYAALQLRGGLGASYDLNIETNPGGVTAHSTRISITQGETYWCSLTADFTTGVSEMWIYNTDYTLNANVIATQTTGEDINECRIGNNETGNGVGTSFFDQIMFGWNVQTAPLGPGELPVPQPPVFPKFPLRKPATGAKSQ